MKLKPAKKPAAKKAVKAKKPVKKTVFTYTPPPLPSMYGMANTAEDAAITLTGVVGVLELCIEQSTAYLSSDPNPEVFNLLVTTLKGVEDKVWDLSDHLYRKSATVKE